MGTLNIVKVATARHAKTEGTGASARAGPGSGVAGVGTQGAGPRAENFPSTKLSVTAPWARTQHGVVPAGAMGVGAPEIKGSPVKASPDRLALMKRTKRLTTKLGLNDASGARTDEPPTHFTKKRQSKVHKLTTKLDLKDASGARTDGISTHSITVLLMRKS